MLGRIAEIETLEASCTSTAMATTRANALPLCALKIPSGEPLVNLLGRDLYLRGDTSQAIGVLRAREVSLQEARFRIKYTRFRGYGNETM